MTKEQVLQGFEMLSPVEQSEILDSIFDGMQDEEIAEAVKNHIRKDLSGWRDSEAWQKFLLNTMYETFSPAEVFEQLTKSTMTKTEAEDFHKEVQQYKTQIGEWISVKIEGAEKRSRLEEFICTHIYPYYNEQQANIQF